MPKQRNFEKIYKDLNIKQIKETPKIPKSELLQVSDMTLPSSHCKIADNIICDFIFEGFVDKKGRLMWKGKVYRLSDDDLKKFRECLMEDLKNLSN